VRALNPALAFAQYLCGSDGVGLWTFDLWVTLPLTVSAVLYGVGLTSLWRRAGLGSGIPGLRAGCFAAGWLVLMLALISPIHRWGTGLYAIHMVEHELVMAIAAPLLVLGRPGGAFAWGMPSAVLKRLGPLLRRSEVRALWSGATRPIAATLLHGAAIWIWHVPVMFDAAVTDVTLHRFQHVSFLVTGLLFWGALLRRGNPGIAAAHLFATMLHTSILGAIIALAPHVLYRLQTQSAEQWGMTPLEDQQLAGLIMWVPAGLIYAAAALLFVAAWVTRSGRRPLVLSVAGAYRGVD
jgi:cytochrome c oxidase assembly factor CtaG